MHFDKWSKWWYGWYLREYGANGWRFSVGPLCLDWFPRGFTSSGRGMLYVRLGKLALRIG